MKAGDVVGDATRATPHTSYGMTKACAELLLQDYSRAASSTAARRGCRPSRCARARRTRRRPGCYSGVVREPRAGVDVVAPIADDVAHAVTGHRTAVGALATLHEAPAAEVDAVLGFDRTVFIPSAALTPPSSRRPRARSSRPTRAARSAACATRSTPSSRPRSARSPRASTERARARSASRPTGSTPRAARAYAEDFPGAPRPACGCSPRRARPPRRRSRRAARAARRAAGARARQRRCAAAARRRVVVTGGGTGIAPRGRAAARRRAIGCSSGARGAGNGAPDGEGVAIVLTRRRREPLEETAALIADAAAAARARARVATLVCPADLTAPADVAALFARVRADYGRLDVLFNNAGANVPPTPVDEMTLGAWRSVLAINVDAAFHVAQEAFVLMKAQSPQRRPHREQRQRPAAVPRPGSCAYTASKHAITGLTKSIAVTAATRASRAARSTTATSRARRSRPRWRSAMPQADGTMRPEPRMSRRRRRRRPLQGSLPLSANVLSMTVMATAMPRRPRRQKAASRPCRRAHDAAGRHALRGARGRRARCGHAVRLAAVATSTPSMRPATERRVQPRAQTPNDDDGAAPSGAAASTAAARRRRARRRRRLERRATSARAGGGAGARRCQHLRPPTRAACHCTATRARR